MSSNGGAVPFDRAARPLAESPQRVDSSLVLGLAGSSLAAWERFPHGSDIGVRGFGSTQAEAFVQAALALVSVITDPALVRAQQAVRVSCRAPDPELLLVDWLNALISAMATEEMLFGRFDVRIADGKLDAVAYGEPIDAIRHRPAVEIKGATFTELQVAQDRDGRWRAQCVVDV